MAIHLVQYSPEIPQNTGNIMRTCVATGVKLHLIKPMGFDLDAKSVKRSGANYVNDVEYITYENWEEFVEKNKGGNFYFCSQFAQRKYSEIDFSDVDAEHYIILGSESNGFPEEILKAHFENCFRVPMTEKVSSLNVSNIAAIISYEALRQQDFLNLWKVEPNKGPDWILRDE